MRQYCVGHERKVLNEHGTALSNERHPAALANSAAPYGAEFL